MKRTTSKEVKTAIRKYILDRIDLSGYDLDQNSMSANEQIKTVHDIFCSEMKWAITRYGEENAFVDWLRGLPSAIAIHFYYCDERALLKEWMQQTDYESEQYKDDAVDKCYASLSFNHSAANKAPCRPFKNMLQ